MENQFTEWLQVLGRQNYRKLSFEDQCAYYAALILHLDPANPVSPEKRRPIPPAAIASVAGVSSATISLLAGAGQVRGGQLRYPKVANEYRALGHDAFIHKYLTAPIRDRLAVALNQSDHAERNVDINEHGYNPRANRYVGRVEWTEAQSSIGLHSIVRIELHPNRGGYFWRNLKPDPYFPEVHYDAVPFNLACQINGDPSRGPERGSEAKGFPTSEACFRHVKRERNPSAAQLAETNNG